MNSPTKLDFLAICRAMPQIAVQFARTIPAEFWTMIEADVAEVCCPCGNSPHVPKLVPTECACPRFFLYDGTNMRVAHTAVA